MVPASTLTLLKFKVNLRVFWLIVSSQVVLDKQKEFADNFFELQCSFHRASAKTCKNKKFLRKNSKYYACSSRHFRCKSYKVCVIRNSSLRKSFHDPLIQFNDGTMFKILKVHIASSLHLKQTLEKDTAVSTVTRWFRWQKSYF